MMRWLLIFPVVAFPSHDVTTVSEAMGHLIGQNLDSFSLELDLDAILKGLKDEGQGIASPLTKEEFHIAIEHLQNEKINEINEAKLTQADCISNTPDFLDENNPIPSPDPSKYR